MEEILEYFPELSPIQREQFSAMAPLYAEWNSKINVISRKDIDNFNVHHALHSLAIAKVVSFPHGSRILDAGTGGGFPGIPLAVLFPGCSFTLCDSIGKKIKVASAVAESLGLQNVRCINCRAEALEEKFDYVVSRAVTSLDQFYPWIRDSFTKAAVCLKGGNITEEIAACASRCRVSTAKFFVTEISSFFKEDYFETKKIVTITK